jgi:PAS domain S-box-containing protein
MTEEKRPPTAPRDAEEQYRLLMENVKDYAIFLMDPKGHIVTWNNAAKRILGYEEEEILGEPFSMLFTSLDTDNRQPEHELSTALTTGRAEDERWHVRKDGSQFWASGVVTPLWDEGGKLRGFAKIMRDITDRKLREVELAEENRRKDEFLATLAHELRNPLAPILNGLRFLQQNQTMAPAQQQVVGMIDRQVRQIVRLVDDLLDVSRITRGKVVLHKERVPLNAALAHAVETARPLIDSRKHELTVSLPSEGVWLETDPARLEQVVANLLNNAAKYTEPGGRIWLTAEREGSEAVIRVRDNGIGILSEMLPRVFDLFTQADRSLDRAQGGLGIGLTLVKRLVELHGGRVEAQSEGPGKGSEFVVRLPVVPEVGGLKPEAIRKIEQKGRPLRLLVVDDNVDTSESLSMLLKLYGHEVEVAHTGPTGLQAFELHKPDVVLLDIGLPGIDGCEVARRIRERAGSSKPLLIATTGYGQESDRQQTKEAGFDHHLVKPVDPNKLQDLLIEYGRQE